jgi:hypothetical protein
VNEIYSELWLNCRLLAIVSYDTVGRGKGFEVVLNGFDLGLVLSDLFSS